MPPERASAGPEAPATTAERLRAAEHAVGARQNETRNAAANVLGRRTIGDRLSERVGSMTTPVTEAWKPLPALPKEEIGKTLAAAAFIANPVATSVVGGGAYVGYKTWNKLAQHRPFSWMDRGARRGAEMAVDGVRSISSVASYPFRLAARLSANVLRIGARATYKTLDATVFELIRDVEDAVNHKFDLPEGTNLLAQGLIGGKRFLRGVTIDAPKFLLKQAIVHPIRTTIGSALALGLLANAGWNPVLAGKHLVDGFGMLLDVIVKYFTRGAAVGVSGV